MHKFMLILTLIPCATTHIVAARLKPNKQLTQAIAIKDTQAIIDALQNEDFPDKAAVLYITQAVNTQSKPSWSTTALLTSAAGNYAGSVYCLTSQDTSLGSVPVVLGSLGMIIAVLGTGLAYNQFQNPSVLLKDDGNKLVLEALKDRALAELAAREEDLYPFDVPSYTETLTQAYEQLQQPSTPKELNKNLIMIREVTCRTFDWSHKLQI